MENIGILVEQSRGGDREAFARIVRQYQGMVSAATLNVVGNYAQSEDLAQETFLTAWKKLPELREPEKLASWLYGIARRVALRWIEKQQRDPLRKTAELDAETLTDQQVQLEAEERQHREQSLALVWAMVKELPETLREPLLLYYRYSKSVADIAASLALTEETVRQRLSRGRKMLKAEVEKQVESVLETTGPGEVFTVGVLAALPITLTGNQVFAAGSAGAAASQAANSGGAGAGASFVAGITTFFWTLFSTFFATLYIILFFHLPVILGIWNGIRNAPTLRARQLMIKVTFGYVVAGSICYTLLHLVTIGYFFYGADTFLRNVCFGTFYLLVGIIPVFVIVVSLLVNRRWRKIVEEDTTSPDFVETPTPNDFARSVYFGAGIVSCVLILAFVVPAAVASYFWGGWVFPLYHSYDEVSLSFWVAHCLCFGLVVLMIVFAFFHCAVQMSKDHDSFAKHPPRLPNLLSILMGEEKAPRGFRNRINFWGDLVCIGWGLLIMEVRLVSRYLGITSVDVFLLLILVVYFLFALFFAGIPRRRYWGMIFLGVSVLLINVSAHFMLSEISYVRYAHVRLQLLLEYGLSAWYMLCFTLLGVSGLWVFRKKR